MEIELGTKQFFLSESLSDVTLVAGDEEFPAHQFWLSCRSPVFESMFRNEMKEKKEGRVVIEDMDPKVLKELLRYLYVGERSLTGLQNNMMIALFKSADKYEIGDLKRICRTSIFKSLSLENAVECYVLGVIYKEDSLLHPASFVIKRNKSAVFKDSAAFCNFTKEYPDLAYAIFRL